MTFSRETDQSNLNSVFGWTDWLLDIRYLRMYLSAALNRIDLGTSSRLLSDNKAKLKSIPVMIRCLHSTTTFWEYDSDSTIASLPIFTFLIHLSVLTLFRGDLSANICGILCGDRSVDRYVDLSSGSIVKGLRRFEKLSIDNLYLALRAHGECRLLDIFRSWRTKGA